MGPPCGLSGGILPSVKLTYLTYMYLKRMADMLYVDTPVYCHAHLQIWNLKQNSYQLDTSYKIETIYS
jgi:hypothetical protein